MFNYFKVLSVGGTVADGASDVSLEGLRARLGKLSSAGRLFIVVRSLTSRIKSDFGGKFIFPVIGDKSEVSQSKSVYEQLVACLTSLGINKKPLERNRVNNSYEVVLTPEEYNKFADAMKSDEKVFLSSMKAIDTDWYRNQDGSFETVGF